MVIIVNNLIKKSYDGFSPDYNYFPMYKDAIKPAKVPATFMISPIYPI